MSASGSVRWLRRESPRSARERLGDCVRALTRARRLQLVVDHAFAGLLAGLGLAALVVLCVRLTLDDAPTWSLAGGALAAALAAALIAAWLRRPDPLEVAIRADVRLKLDQRLSTAWEYMTLRAEGPLADRLAAQALAAGLPPRPAAVFPLRVNRWGKLAPLAAVALVLAAVVDVDRMRAPAPASVDELLAAEGRRLAAFARTMQARTERDKLPVSAQEAAKIERLGARMQVSGLGRGQALGELERMQRSLDEARKQALADAGLAGANLQRGRDGAIPASALRPLQTLERLQRGSLDGADAASLSEHLGDLERAGIPRREVEQALERHRAGDDEPLRELMKKLAPFERALKEEQELRSAREQVQRALENLDDAQPRDSRRQARAGTAWDDDEEAGERGAAGVSKSATDESAKGSLAGQAVRAPSASAGGGEGERQDSPLREEPGPGAPIVTVQGQLRAGESASTEGRVLPRLNNATADEIPVNAQFARQVEEVMSKEQYPAHLKAFVRRYFVALSEAQGGRARPDPAAARGDK